MKTHPLLIIPQWPAPKNIHAFTTTRTTDISQLPLPRQPIRLNQTHSTIAIKLTSETPSIIQEPSDASFTQEQQLPCAVLTADCLPLLICNQSGTEVAAIHAGWRGLLAGIIENTIQQLTSKPTDLLVWLGPAIGPTAFHVDDQIRVDFINRYPQNEQAFEKTATGWLANIYMLAKTALLTAGVSNVFGGHDCTVSDAERFFSYRRDGAQTGRMISVIWIDSL